MKKKALITGVNGFIGQALWQFLKRHKKTIQVFGIDLMKTSGVPGISSMDMRDSRRFGHFLDNISPDYIFHLAGGRMNDAAKLKESNIETTKALFTTLLQIAHIPAKIVIPGSAAEYGEPPANVRRISERAIAVPLSDYGKVKFKQTDLAFQYSTLGFNVVVARLFNITGANTPDQLAAGRFSKEIVRLEQGNKTGALNTMSLKGRRDFLDIEDICSALWHLAESGRSGQIYNVCSSVPTRIEDLLFKLILFSRLTDVEIIEDESSGSKSFDVIGSNAKLRAHTPWKQEISLDKSLVRTLKSWRKQLGVQL
ncbi:MAG: NAD-dependent epimerase/dehydratase family protein [Candidatus Omnitrophota bacterium]